MAINIEPSTGTCPKRYMPPLRHHQRAFLSHLGFLRSLPPLHILERLPTEIASMIAPYMSQVSFDKCCKVSKHWCHMVPRDLERYPTHHALLCPRLADDVLGASQGSPQRPISALLSGMTPSQPQTLRFDLFIRVDSEMNIFIGSGEDMIIGIKKGDVLHEWRWEEFKQPWQWQWQQANGPGSTGYSAG